MSNKYSPTQKELAGVKVVPASDVWVYNPKTGRPDKLNPNMDIVGKVDTAMPGMVLKANLRDKKTGFVEDVSALPKRTKGELVNHFYDERGRRNSREVAYLVRTDKDAKGKGGN